MYTAHHASMVIIFQEILRRSQNQPAEDPILRKGKLPLGVSRIRGSAGGFRRRRVPQQLETLVLSRTKLQ